MLKKYLLHIVLTFLIFLYVLSFFLNSIKNGGKIIKSTLINPSNIEKTTKIEIEDGYNKITLTKKLTKWTGESDDGLNFPVEENNIESFFAAFTKTRKIAEVNKKTDLKNFGLDTDNSKKITYTLENSQSYTIFFGNYDFTGTKIYFNTENGDSVFETNSEIDIFVNAKTSFWTDPMLIPDIFPEDIKVENIERIVFSENGKNTLLTYKTEEDYSKIKKLLELRHGNIGLAQGKKTGTLTILTNSLGKIEMEFYETPEEEYWVKYNIPELSNYSAELSPWTLNQIRSQFK